MVVHDTAFGKAPFFRNEMWGYLEGDINKQHKLQYKLLYSQVQYNTTLLPSVNTIALGMFCGAKYIHHTLTPIIKHYTTTNIKHRSKKSFINKHMRNPKWHQGRDSTK